MTFNFTLIGSIMIGSALLSILLAIYVWRRRYISGGVWFSIMMVSSSAWAFFAGLLDMAIERETKILFEKLTFLGVATVATLWFIFAVRYSGRDAWLKRSRLPLFWVVPVVVFAAAMTNDYHRLVWPSITAVPGRSYMMLHFALGPIVFVNMAYSYILLLLGMFIIVRATVSSETLYSKQTWALILAVIIPWVCNIGFVAGLSPPGFDPTTIAFVAAGSLVAWSLFRYKLLDLLPVAHEALIAGMSDGVVVVDEFNRIVEVNGTAREFFKLSEGCVGRPAEGLLSCWAEMMKNIKDGNDTRFDIQSRLDGMERWFNIHVSLVRDKFGRSKGRLLIFHDISERKQAEEALQESEKEYRELSTKLRDAYLCMRQRKDEILARKYSESSIFLITEDGRICGFTEEAVGMTKKIHSDIQGCNIHDIFVSPEGQPLMDILHNVRPKMSHLTTLTLKNQPEDGPVYEAKLTCIVVDNRRLYSIILS